MPKKIVQDVVPRRTIRDIPLPESKSGKKERPNPPVPPPKASSRNGSPPIRSKVPADRNYTRGIIWTVAVVCVIGLGYAASFLFASATISLSPKTRQVSVDLTVNAQKDAQSALSYTLLSISKEGSREVKATGEEKVERKASGKIVIYNNHSNLPQTLVKNTRFENPDGLIFRIDEAVVVPGRSTKNSETLPGSVKATVYADEPGEKYNIGLSDFTIPGFRSDPRYKNFSAKSDPTSPISGGFIGTVKKVSEADAALAKSGIENSLKSELLAQARSQIPDSHILFDDMTQFSFEQLPQGASSEGNALIKEKGTIQGVLFDRRELADIIADETVNVENESEKAPEKEPRIFYAKNLEELTVTFKNKSTFIPNNSGAVSAELKGNVLLVRDIENSVSSGAIQQILAGEKRSRADEVLSDFDSIENVSIVVRPVWSLSFPKKAEKIRVKILNP